MPAKTTNNKKIPIKEIIKPAIAKPLGLLNTPIKDRRSPKNQIIQPNTGIHPKNRASNANTNPATPNPFDCDIC